MTDLKGSELPAEVLALASLAAFIASNHPKKGFCQLEILREKKVPQAHIDMVVEIARHLRDEAAQFTDSEFDAVYSAQSNKY